MSGNTSDDEHSRFARQFAQIDPDLARVLDAWPSLPEAIRRAVLALVESVVG